MDSLQLRNDDGRSGRLWNGEMNEQELISWVAMQESNARARANKTNAELSPRAFGYWDGQADLAAALLKKLGAL